MPLIKFFVTQTYPLLSSLRFGLDDQLYTIQSKQTINNTIFESSGLRGTCCEEIILHLTHWVDLSLNLGHISMKLVQNADMGKTEKIHKHLKRAPHRQVTHSQTMALCFSSVLVSVLTTLPITQADVSSLWETWGCIRTRYDQIKHDWMENGKLPPSTRLLLSSYCIMPPFASLSTSRWATGSVAMETMTPLFYMQIHLS